jgi:hypothetical protein
MPCNCGSSKVRQTITSADAESMRLAKESDHKYMVTAPDGATAYSGNSYTDAARARRRTGGTLTSVRSA